MAGSQPLGGQFLGVVPGEPPVGIAAQDCTRYLAQTRCRASACKLGLDDHLLANRPSCGIAHIDSARRRAP